MPPDPCRLARPVNESCERRGELTRASQDPCRLVRPVNESCERRADRAWLTRLIHRPGKRAGVW